MATYTPSWNLLKIDTSGEDLIDAESQVSRNLSIIDDRGFRAKGYKIYNVPIGSLPSVSNDFGNYIYNHYDSSVYVWDRGAWVASGMSSASSSTWVPLPLGVDIDAQTGVNMPPAYKIVANGGKRRVRFRGRLNRVAFDVFPRNNDVAIASLSIATGARPSHLAVEHTVCGGNGPRYYRIAVTTSGIVTATYMSDADQVAGSTGNYVDISSISYTLD